MEGQVGLEPTYSSYGIAFRRRSRYCPVVSPPGFEPGACRLGNDRSVRMSYGDVLMLAAILTTFALISRNGQAGDQHTQQNKYLSQAS